MPSRREAIAAWRNIASLCIEPDAGIVAQANSLSVTYALKSFDALHVACAVAAGADLFVTTDDFVLKKLKTDLAPEKRTP